MSTPQPPRRRRIAGESKPGTPAPPRPAPKKNPLGRRPAKPKKAEPRPPAPPPPPPRSAVSTPAPTKAPEAPAPTETAPTATAPTEDGSRERRLNLPVLRRPGRFTALVALAVAALVFGAVFGITGWNDWRNDSSITDAHDKAAATAASAAETIFTYRYDKLDEHLDDAKGTMTSSFAKKFETISPALNDLAPQRKIQVKATTRDSAAIECGQSCDADKASVLVFIDQARLADGSDQPTVFGNRIELRMVKQDGKWLVNNIKAL